LNILYKDIDPTKYPTLKQVFVSTAKKGHNSTDLKNMGFLRNKAPITGLPTMPWR